MKSVALILSFASCTLAGVQDAGHTVSNSLDEAKVEELLLQDTPPSKADLKEMEHMVIQYLTKYRMEMSPEEAMSLVGMVKVDESEDAAVRMKQVQKMLDAGEILRKRLNKCPGGVGHSASMSKMLKLREKTNAFKIKAALSGVTASFVCPNPVAGVKSKDDKKSSDKSFSFIEMAKSFDFGYLQDLKKQLKEDPAPLIGKLFDYLVVNKWITKETMPVAQMIRAQLVSIPEYLEYPIALIDAMELFFHSESGKRIATLIPALMNASDTDKATELLAKEADFNQEVLMGMLKNTDRANAIVKGLARFLITSYQWVQDALNDTLRMAVFNGMLISNDFPILDKRNLLRSVVNIGTKVAKYFTTSRVEDYDIYKDLRVMCDDFEKQYFKFSDLGRFNEQELETIISQFLQDTAVQPIIDTWRAHKHVTGTDAGCSATTLCLFNLKYAKENILKRETARGCTNVLALAWPTISDEFKQDALAASIHVGIDKESKEEDCFGLYNGKQESSKCQVFKSSALVSDGMMNLGYEHNEL